jgi:IS5 family transposase
MQCNRTGSLEQVRRLTGKVPEVLAADRGYRGKKQSGDTEVIPLKSDIRYKREKKRKLFCKRAEIEPRISHLKSDHRLGRNFYKGTPGDASILCSQWQHLTSKER